MKPVAATRQLRRLIILAVCLVIVVLTTAGCAFAQADNPANPSYRLVTTQILDIDAALGIRGGLAALVGAGAAAASVSSTGMSGMAASRPAAPATLSWSRIAQKINVIETAWADLRSELERRKVSGAEQPYWYIKYYRIMAIEDSVDMTLAAIKAQMAAKQGAQITSSVAELTEAFERVKRELSTPVVDSRRFALVSGGVVMIWMALTVSSSVVARRRDRKLVMPKHTGQAGQLG